MTYLQLVNAVLARLRESSVSAISNSTYATMIGKLVNDAKRQVEDSWNWDALSASLSASTTPSTSTLVVTGSGLRPKGITVNNTTSRYQLRNVPLQWIIDQQDLSTAQSGAPMYYAWNGNDGTDSKVELFPAPDSAYTMRFHITRPQVALSADADVMLIPSEPVELLAYARAIVERGEDGGLNSSEAYSLAKSSLADHIALEATRFTENDEWVAM